YIVYTASNGIEGINVLLHHTVTLIVSDWMMPEMDGVAFCRHVRADQNTSHIPFIMLTAKTDDESKTESMNCGADAYIEKPFSVKYLNACIGNLISMRKLLMKKFSDTPTEPITHIARTPLDNDFLLRMNRLIEDNIDNADLSVNFIAEKMNISRSSLFAKIKSLADVTPNEMIQIVRLRRAAQLLKGDNYRINEVCFMVGFSSPSYFAKCFQKQFGVKPTDYR
ncbi:MAG: helix-turn-helix domain-containing protein, partial [Prevotella sp.]|nr:helix-turn-helix domain-containing protein [Prevotella sp.]